jgi:hypothetical protein
MAGTSPMAKKQRQARSGEPAEQHRQQRHRDRVADRVSALDGRGHTAPKPRLDYLHDQHRADGGLCAISDPLDGARHRQIGEAVGEGRGEGR